MKNFFKIKLMLALFVISGLLISCDDEYNETKPVADTTITGVASNTPSLSILVQALTRANLAATLQGSGPFTVFAPTNEAFTLFLQQNNFANLEAVPLPLLREVLLNHVVSGRSLAANLTNNTYIKTLAVGKSSANNTLSMYVSTANGVMLNGVSTVRTADVPASNGVVHIVDRVIGLPTIVTHATANPAFSELVRILTSTPQASILTAITTNTTPLTVFAPTNAAFNTALGTGGFANGASNAQVSRVLLHHVANGNVLAGSLTAGQIIPTLATNPQQNLTVNLVGGAGLTDNSTTKANIVVTDVQCDNGIVHAVSKVLQPQL